MRKLVTELSYLLIGDYRYYYYRKLKSRLKLSKDEIVNIQNQNIQKLITHAYNHSLYYRALFDKSKISVLEIRSKEDFEKIPILTKELLNRNGGTILCSNYKKSKMIKVTSGGSTGNQSIVYKSPLANSISHAYYLSHMRMTGWNPMDKCVWIWGAPYEHEKIKKSVLARIGAKLNNRLLFNAYNYSTKDFDSWIDQINKFAPKIVFGYASILGELAEYLYKKGIQFPSVKIVVSTTEKLEKRETIQRAFNCKVFDQYGCREVPMIAVECPKGHLHIAEDHVVVESVNDEILLTDLHSYGFPLIRYKVGDTGNILKNKEYCEKKFSQLDLKIGRITDNFYRSDGQKVSSSALATYISTKELQIKEYQIIQKESKIFEINYVPIKELNENDKGLLQKILAEYFGEILVTFNMVDRIKPEVSGKKLLFKCLINN